jgi:cell division protein FtsI/penicillin-binding protein 2
MRQPGSSFKPYVYLAALEQGIPPNQRYLDGPIEIITPQGPWRPGNFGDTITNNYITMRGALEKSLKKSADTAKQMNADSTAATIKNSQIPTLNKQFVQSTSASIQSAQVAKAAQDAMNIKAGVNVKVNAADIVTQLKVAGASGGAALKQSLDSILAKAGIGGAQRIKIGTVLQNCNKKTGFTLKVESAGCAAVRDPLHTLRRSLPVARTTVAGSMGGRRYNSAYALDGTSPSRYLLVGNANGDANIDILDYGTYVTQRGQTLAVNTAAGTTGPHCDFSGNGPVTVSDLTFLAANIFKSDEVCNGFTEGGTPVRRISVRELRRLGLGELAAGDLNGDGWVDERDLAMAMQGDAAQAPAGGADATLPKEE